MPTKVWQLQKAQKLRATESPEALRLRVSVAAFFSGYPAPPWHRFRGFYGTLTSAMFVIELSYKATLTRIDAHMTAHVRFLKKYYASGHFLVSGRKIPRDGGIIVAVGKSRDEIESLMQEDPFVAHGLADFRVIEFRASQRADDMPKRVEA